MSVFVCLFCPSKMYKRSVGPLILILILILLLLHCPPVVVVVGEEGGVAVGGKF